MQHHTITADAAPPCHGTCGTQTQHYELTGARMLSATARVREPSRNSTAVATIKTAVLLPYCDIMITIRMIPLPRCRSRCRCGSTCGNRTLIKRTRHHTHARLPQAKRTLWPTPPGHPTTRLLLLRRPWRRPDSRRRLGQREGGEISAGQYFSRRQIRRGRAPAQVRPPAEFTAQVAWPLIGPAQWARSG